MATAEGGDTTLHTITWNPRQNEKLFSLSYFNDIDDIFQETENDTNLLSVVRNALQRKYNKFTSVLLDTEGWPSRFCYHDETEDYNPHSEEYTRIVNVRYAPMFENCTSVWQKLDEQSQDKLYLLLCTARRIFHRLVFSYDHDTWVLRSSPVVKQDTISHITYYGMVPHPGDGIGPFSGVLDYLGRGRSAAEIKDALKSLQSSYLGYQKIEDVWQLGLTAGMTNGLGRTAVYNLLDHIAGLVYGLHTSEVFSDVVPKLAILNVTSSTADDSFSIVSSASPARTRSSATPPTKRRKTEKQPTTDNSEQKHSKESNKKDVPKKVTFPNHNRHYVDMTVVCMDGTSGVTKYILLVEIHSSGKSISAAMRKFTSEIIHTLQAQNVVFGLFFGKIDVVLITASKQTNGQIYISEQTYSLVEGPLGDNFSVKNFQLLIMDIFSCMIYGMKNINA